MKVLFIVALVCVAFAAFNETAESIVLGNSSVPVDPYAPLCNFNFCGDIGGGGSYVGCTVIFSQCSDQGQACVCSAVSGGSQGVCNVLPLFGATTCVTVADCPVQSGKDARCFNGCCEYLAQPPPTPTPTPSPSRDPFNTVVCPLELNAPPCAKLRCIGNICNLIGQYDCNVNNPACSCACSFGVAVGQPGEADFFCTTNAYYGLTPPNCPATSPDGCWNLLPEGGTQSCCEYGGVSPIGCQSGTQPGWGSITPTISPSPSVTAQPTGTPTRTALPTSAPTMTPIPTANPSPSFVPVNLCGNGVINPQEECDSGLLFVTGVWGQVQTPPNTFGGPWSCSPQTAPFMVLVLQFFAQVYSNTVYPEIIETINEPYGSNTPTQLPGPYVLNCGQPDSTHLTFTFIPSPIPLPYVTMIFTYVVPFGTTCFNYDPSLASSGYQFVNVVGQYYDDSGNVCNYGPVTDPVFGLNPLLEDSLCCVGCNINQDHIGLPCAQGGGLVCMPDGTSALPSSTPSLSPSPSLSASPSLSPTVTASPFPSPTGMATETVSPSAVPTSSTTRAPGGSTSGGGGGGGGPVSVSIEVNVRPGEEEEGEEEAPRFPLWWLWFLLPIGVVIFVVGMVAFTSRTRTYRKDTRYGR